MFVYLTGGFVTGGYDANYFITPDGLFVPQQLVYYNGEATVVPAPAASPSSPSPEVPSFDPVIMKDLIRKQM